MIDIIDPHVHVWQLSAGHYHWLRQANPPHWPAKALLQKDFLPAKLALQPPFRLHGVVHIEAGFNNQQPEQELAWLRKQDWPCANKSVAFLDCAAPLGQVESQLQALLPYQPAGVRHIFDGNDEQVLHRTELHTIAGWLCQQQLLMEVQCNVTNPKNLARITQLAELFPQLRLVLNHAGFVKPERFSVWQQALNALGTSPNIAMKLSGWEMLHTGERSPFDSAWFQRVLSAALEHLPTERLMLASNFPLCLWQGSYQQLWQGYFDQCQALGLSAADWQELSRYSASRCYEFDAKG
ncbi:amidohydrolase family protein [Alkalimonas amylolytica]|uniref:Predicted metal-dependent hydrolase, TIM-barrel fold n=1 Tax=Alkalimonas amylolytica TaxID=152573 RepID=A0A1H3ZQJ3_ALKAM|nr:amidohydrolase family protein [Alkalimonas amylolytica]SEA25969.1 Predicted metal-dependent hydrolase, TIM-barrel fold [Alkalimonas amylolytica]